MTNPIKPSDTIIGPPRGDALMAKKAVHSFVPIPDSRHVLTYIDEVYRLAPLVGIDPAIVVAQSAVETGNWGEIPGAGATAWLERRNPGSIGITSTGKPGEPDVDHMHSWKDGTDAARGQIVHLIAYLAGLDGLLAVANILRDYKHLDPRFKAVFDAGYMGTVRLLSDLGNGKWAADKDYAAKIAARGNQLFQFAKETPPVATKPKILLTRGHGTTGDTGAIVGPHAEEAYNKRIVPAIAKHLRAAGYDVATYPANPTDDVPGTLDTEGAFARQWIANTPGEVVMLDCHLESSSARGIFAIVANDVGLHTAAPGAQPWTDTYANNAGDRALGKAICEEISRLTGVPIRTGWVKEPGLMSEDMTYVGGQGWRLAMFGYTAEYHARAYRLVVEFANLQNDAAFFTRADFAERCGQGVTLAMNRVFGVEAVPTPETPRYAKPKPIAALARLDAGDRAGLAAVTLKEGESFEVFRREVEAIRATPRYQIASATSKARVGPDIAKGERFVPAWRFIAGDGAVWYLSAAWTRVRAEDVRLVDDAIVAAA